MRIKLFFFFFFFCPFCFIKMIWWMANRRSPATEDDGKNRRKIIREEKENWRKVAGELGEGDDRMGSVLGRGRFTQHKSQPTIKFHFGPNTRPNLLDHPDRSPRRLQPITPRPTMTTQVKTQKPRPVSMQGPMRDPRTRKMRPEIPTLDP